MRVKVFSELRRLFLLREKALCISQEHRGLTLPVSAGAKIQHLGVLIGGDEITP